MKEGLKVLMERLTKFLVFISIYFLKKQNLLKENKINKVFENKTPIIGGLYKI